MGLDYLGNHMKINVSKLLTGKFEIILDLGIKLMYSTCICIRIYIYANIYTHTIHMHTLT